MPASLPAVQRCQHTCPPPAAHLLLQLAAQRLVLGLSGSQIPGLLLSRGLAVDLQARGATSHLRWLSIQACVVCSRAGIPAGRHL
jgi:hypothetical protein